MTMISGNSRKITIH